MEEGVPKKSEMMVSLNINEVVKKIPREQGLGPDYENHKEGEKELAASPSTFINPSIQQPEMMGRLRLSSIDPRSEYIYKSYLVSKISKAVLNNAPRASATPLTTPVTRAMANNLKGPPAPIATFAPFFASA
jgi:hypothetical protein